MACLSTPSLIWHLHEVPSAIILISFELFFIAGKSRRNLFNWNYVKKRSLLIAGEVLNENNDENIETPGNIFFRSPQKKFLWLYFFCKKSHFHWFFYWILIDSHWFSLNFIDFHRFLLVFMGFWLIFIDFHWIFTDFHLFLLDFHWFSSIFMGFLLDFHFFVDFFEFHTFQVIIRFSWFFWCFFS